MTADIPAIQIQVNSSLDAPGGGAVHARGLARALRKRGADVSLLCTGWTGNALDPQFGNVIVARPKNLPLLWRRPPLGVLPFWVHTIRKHAVGVDAIVALSAEMAVASHLARPRTPMVYCPAALHGIEHPAARLTSLQRCERRAFRTAAGLVYPAEAVREAIEDLYGPLNVPAAVCPLGVDLERIDAGSDVRAAYGIPPGAFVLLTVGVINENKGQALIAGALANSTPPNWWWIIVGDGPDRDAVETTLRGTAFGDHTVFGGGSVPIADWYATANVAVSASRCETFGLAIAEALAAGLPVVLPENRLGSTLSPLADLVTTNSLGCSFQRDRPESLRAALSELAVDPCRRARIGARARQFARTHFSWDRYAECVLSRITSAAHAARVPAGVLND